MKKALSLLFFVVFGITTLWAQNTSQLQQPENEGIELKQQKPIWTGKRNEQPVQAISNQQNDTISIQRRSPSGTFVKQNTEAAETKKEEEEK